MTIRVLIADDQAMVRAGLRSLLSREPDIEVVAEAADGGTAMVLAVEDRPDIILMDIRMPIVDGLTATRRLVAKGLHSRVLILTTFDLDEYVFEALRAGASGFLLKDATPDQLTAAVRTLADGNALLDPAVTRRVITLFVNQKLPAARDHGQISRLTEREKQVWQLLARGLSNAEIADTLTVTDATAKTHVSNVLTKLGLRDRVHAVILAYETGLVG
jgi:DNA-binding NarL/FixJ family response regulator